MFGKNIMPMMANCRSMFNPLCWKVSILRYANFWFKIILWEIRLYRHLGFWIYHIFLLICTYYQFDVLLEKTVKFCLSEGLHYFPVTFQTLETIGGISCDWVKQMIQGFEDLWDTHQSTELISYLAFPTSDQTTNPNADEILASGFKESIEILPGLVRSLIQSPDFRMDKIFFPICPVCEFYVRPTEGVLTSCCYEPIHESCQL